MSELRRNELTNRFIDLVAAEADCSAIECLFLENQIPRWQASVDTALALPHGSDIDPYLGDIAQSWVDWDRCLDGATDRFECEAEEADVEAAFTALYNALR